MPLPIPPRPVPQRRKPPLIWLARSLPYIALGLSAYLSWVALTEGVPLGCSGESTTFDCQDVLNTRWSKWLDLPVAPFGLLVYSALAGLAWLIGNDQPWIPSAWRALLIGLVTLAMGSAVWFVFLQFFVLQHLCPYCLAIHACGLGLGVLLLLMRDRGAAVQTSFQERSLAILAGSLPLVLLVVGQVWFPGKSYLVMNDAPIDAVTLDHVASPASIPSPASATEQAGKLPSEQQPSPPTAADLPTDAPGVESTSSSGSTVVSSPPTATPADTLPSGSEPATEASVDRAPTTASPVPAAESAAPDNSLDALLAVPEPSVVDAEAVGGPVTPAASATGLPDTSSNADATPTPAASAAAANPGLPSSPMQGGRKGRVLTFFNNAIRIDTREHPRIGEPDAPAVVVELFDYTCSSCRALAALFKKAENRFGKQFAVIALPCPLSKDCNKSIEKDQPVHATACKLAQISLAVWERSPENFPAYHAWLMTGPKAPSLDDALKKAMEFVDKDSLRKAINSDQVLNRLANYTSLYGAMKRQNRRMALPIQLVGQYPIAGLPDDEKQLFKIWQDNLPLAKP